MQKVAKNTEISIKNIMIELKNTIDGVDNRMYTPEQWPDWGDLSEGKRRQNTRKHTWGRLTPTEEMIQKKEKR